MNLIKQTVCILGFVGVFFGLSASYAFEPMEIIVNENIDILERPTLIEVEEKSNTLALQYCDNGECVVFELKVDDDSKLAHFDGKRLSLKEAIQYVDKTLLMVSFDKTNNVIKNLVLNQ